MGVWVGIDPGLSGAMAIIQDVDKVSITFIDTPTIKIKSGKSMKRQMDLSAIVDILDDLGTDAQIHVVLEKVNAMPGQGVTSMFNFGVGFGAWQGMLAAMSIPYTMIHPATWKKAMMPDATKDKDASILRVCQLLPKVGRTLNRKKDHGKADALLMALYGRRTLSGDVPHARTKK